MADEGQEESSTTANPSPRTGGSLSANEAGAVLEQSGLLADDPIFGAPEDAEELSGEEPQVGEEDLEDEEVQEPDEGLDDSEDFEDDPGELADEEDVEAKEEASDDEELFTVKVDGEELEVTLDEALAGYQRQSAFTRKAQEVAREREEVQERLQELTNEREQLAEKLQVVERALRVEEPDWTQLKQQLPEDEYAQERTAYQERREQIEAVEAEIQQAREENARAQQQALQDRLQREQEQLVAKIPEWVDPEKAQADKERLAEGAQEHYGFTPEDLSMVTDHRLILLLRDGIRHREQQSKMEDAKKGARSKRRKSKTLEPGSKSDSKTKQSRKREKKVAAARKRLRKSGSVDDAAATLDEILPDDII